MKLLGNQFISSSSPNVQLFTDVNIFKALHRSELQLMLPCFLPTMCSHTRPTPKFQLFCSFLRLTHVAWADIQTADTFSSILWAPEILDFALRRELCEVLKRFQLPNKLSMEISKDLHVGHIFTSRWAKFSHKLVKSHLGTKFITSSALHISLVFVEILDEILSFNTNALF